MIPFPVIPVDAHPFFASDAFSKDIQPGNPFVVNWGCANTPPQSLLSGQTVDIWVVNGSFAMVANSDEDTLINADVDLQLYEVSIGTNPIGMSARFTGPYGDQVAGKWLNASAHAIEKPSSGGQRNLIDAPIQLRAEVPHDGLYMVGPKILFFSGITVPARVHFEFHIQGAWKKRI